MPTPNQSKMVVKVFTGAFLLLWFGVVRMGPHSQASHAVSQQGGREMGASSAGLACPEELRSAGGAEGGPICRVGELSCVPCAHIQVTAACANTARFQRAHVSPWDRFSCNVRYCNCIGMST